MAFVRPRRLVQLIQPTFRTLTSWNGNFEGIKPTRASMRGGWGWNEAPLKRKGVVYVLYSGHCQLSAYYVGIACKQTFQTRLGYHADKLIGRRCGTAYPTAWREYAAARHQILQIDGADQRIADLTIDPWEELLGDVYISWNTIRKRAAETPQEYKIRLGEMEVAIAFQTEQSCGLNYRFALNKEIFAKRECEAMLQIATPLCSR